MDIFEQLLEELSKEMHLPLKSDEHNTCLIRLKDSLDVQIELDRAQENLIIGIFLGELPAGKYRENILKEALKANSEPPPSIGVFAFSEKKHALVLFETRRIEDVNGAKAHEIMLELYAMALPWKEALSRGDVPYITRKSSGDTKKSDNIFSLKL